MDNRNIQSLMFLWFLQSLAVMNGVVFVETYWQKLRVNK